MSARVLREEHEKILGIFPTQRWPSSDTADEDALRALLADALRAGATDDAHAAALVSLLHALKATSKLVQPTVVGTTKNELNATRSASRRTTGAPRRSARRSTQC